MSLNLKDSTLATGSYDDMKDNSSAPIVAYKAVTPLMERKRGGVLIVGRWG